MVPLWPKFDAFPTIILKVLSSYHVYVTSWHVCDRAKVKSHLQLKQTRPDQKSGGSNPNGEGVCMRKTEK